DVRLGELLLDLGCARASRRLLVRSLVNLAAVENPDRAFRSHDGNLGSGPSEVNVRAYVLRGHDAVCAAVGFARDDCDLGDSGFGEGVEEFRAVAYDAAVLLSYAGEEAGHVLEDDEREVEAVAEAHEA